MIIETKRLFLREMKENDLDMLFKVLGDKENMRYYPYVFDKVHVQRWIKNNIERYRVFGFGLWAVCLKESGEMIGDLSVFTSFQRLLVYKTPKITLNLLKVHLLCKK